MASILLLALICASVQLTVVCGKPQPSPVSPPQLLREGNEESVHGTPTVVELRHSHSIQAGKIPGKALSGWWYFGGSAGNSNSQYDLDGTSFLPKSLWSGRMIDIATTGLYSAAVMALLGTAYFISGPRLLAGDKLFNVPTEKATKNKAADKVSEANVDPAGGNKVRRKREAVVARKPEADADLTRLAAIVLNAVASGECLQKTICQVGTEIGASRNGPAALSLLDTLLPATLHSNSYFVTMKKSLKGDSTCEKFKCNLGYSY